MSREYRLQARLEKSDLVQLKREVLDFGSEAMLPCNLPDAWLSKLERDLENLLEKRIEDHCYMTAPLSMVAHLLYAKNSKGGSEVSFTDEELFEYLQHLRFEISLEIVRRVAGDAPEPATLKTILTNRKLSLR
jgi:hypothetical protein